MSKLISNFIFKYHFRFRNVGQFQTYFTNTGQLSKKLHRMGEVVRTVRHTYKIADKI